MFSLYKKFVISVSYGNSFIKGGGTDKVIREQEDLFRENNISFLALFPVGFSNPFQKEMYMIKAWGINLDGKFMGLFSYAAVRNGLIELCSHGGECAGIFIHHLWRVNTGVVKEILDSVDAPIYYYLHDLRAVCNNGDNNNLLRKDNVFCGFGIEHLKCDKNCEYFMLAQNYRKVFEKYFRRYENRFTMIAPSESVKSIYAAAFPGFRDHIRVILHQREIGSVSKRPRNAERKLKVAFVGAQNSLKGWDRFRELVACPGITDKYDFYYLGNGLERLEGVTVVDVSVQRDGEDAMVKALKSNQIDIALLLSCWPETYSYTYFESYTAGCYIVAMNVSGNIADMVTIKKNGTLVVSTEELIHYFADPDYVKQDIFEFESRNTSLPEELVQNEEILELVGGAQRDRMKEKFHLTGHRWVYEEIYRLVNRKRLQKNK